MHLLEYVELSRQFIERRSMPPRRTCEVNMRSGAMFALQYLERAKDGFVVLVGPRGGRLEEKLLWKAIFFHRGTNCFRRRRLIGIEYRPPRDYDDLVRC